MITNVLKSRLASLSALTDIVGTRYYPVEPTENTSVPFVVFTLTSSDKPITLSGSSGLTMYSFDIEAVAINLDTIQAILEALKAGLHCWTSDDVQLCYLTNEIHQPESDGYIGTQTYVIWGNDE